MWSSVVPSICTAARLSRYRWPVVAAIISARTADHRQHDDVEEAEVRWATTLSTMICVKTGMSIERPAATSARSAARMNVARTAQELQDHRMRDGSTGAVSSSGVRAKSAA